MGTASFIISKPQQLLFMLNDHPLIILIQKNKKNGDHIKPLSIIIFLAKIFLRQLTAIIMRDNKNNRVDEFFSQFAATKDRSRRFQIAVCIILLIAVLLVVASFTKF